MAGNSGDSILNSISEPSTDKILSDKVLATAILDRLLLRATTLNINSESYRLKEKPKGGLLNGPAKSMKAGTEAKTGG